VEELVINPEEKAVEVGQDSQGAAAIETYAPSTVSELARHGRLCVVSEGLSGAGSGAVASQYTAKKIIHAYFVDNASNPRQRLVSAFAQVNTDLFQRNRQYPERRPVATTLTAALIHSNRLLAASVGDNRIYVVWDQDIELLTPGGPEADDPPVQVFSSTQGEANQDPVSPPTTLRQRLPDGIGLGDEAEIDWFTRRLFAGDVVIIISGGLVGYLKDREIARAVNLHSTEEASKRLVALAAERGYRDQCAICVMRVLNESLAAHPPEAVSPPLAPLWSTLETTAAQTQSSSTSASQPASKEAVKPVFTRPPDLIPQSTSSAPWRAIAIGIISLFLITCLGGLVAARTMLPSDLLASMPMADAFGLTVSATPETATPAPPPTTITIPNPPSPTAPDSVTSAETRQSASPSPLPPPESSLVSPVATPPVRGDVVSPLPTPSPTSTVPPLATIAIPPGCNSRGRFVRDVTIPDGTQVAAGELFEKAWLVENADTCPWGPGYTIQRIDGEAMGTPNISPLTITVPPGENGEIRMALTAPIQPGNYRSSWQLFDLNGDPFGPELYLEIEVVPTTLAETSIENILFDFVAQAATATWQSDETNYTVTPTTISETLVIPRPEGIVAIGQAELRGNQQSEGSVLLTYPHMENGYIEGIYPVDTPLQPADILIAELGFPKLSILSDDGVTFEVIFTPMTGEETLVFSQSVEYRDSPVTQIQPLTMIQPEQTGTFTLRVNGGESLNQDWAVWITVQLVRP
jgi:serine/threonine protein phosphatase PrpC